jgi:hypothetical protein
VLPKADRMSHSEGLNSIETALAYVEQQREATATDGASGAGVTLPKRKGRRLRSKYPLLISEKNKLFHIQIYIMTVFVREIFSFDDVLHFLHYLISFIEL